MSPMLIRKLFTWLAKIILDILAISLYNIHIEIKGGFPFQSSGLSIDGCVIDGISTKLSVSSNVLSLKLL